MQISMLPAPHSAYLPSLGKSLSHLAVAATIAGSDEVSDPTALQESGGGDRALTEEFGKANHLHQSQTNHGSLRVVSIAKPITETSSYSHNVLENNSSVEGSVPNGARDFAVSVTCLCNPKHRLLPAPAYADDHHPSKQLNRTHPQFPPTSGL